MTYALRSASEFPLAQLANLLTRGFAEYPVPIHIAESDLLTMLHRDSVDLGASRVALNADETIGVALLARRGATCRLAALGIIPAARKRGAGAWTMRQLLDEAAARGERKMFLEVIEQNLAGVKLYEKTGFQKMRRLFGYQIENPPIESDQTLEELDLCELARLITYYGSKDLPWQLSGATILHHAPPARAFGLNDAYCLISDPSAERVAISSVLVKARARDTDLGPALLRALFARFPNKIWQVSALYPEEVCDDFERVGMRRAEISQWQMSRAL